MAKFGSFRLDITQNRSIKPGSRKENLRPRSSQSSQRQLFTSLVNTQRNHCSHISSRAFRRLQTSDSACARIMLWRDWKSLDDASAFRACYEGNNLMMIFDTKLRDRSIAPTLSDRIFRGIILQPNVDPSNMDSSRENDRSMLESFLKILRRFSFAYFVLVPLLDHNSD